MNKMLETLSEGLPRLGLELPEDVQQTLCAFGEGVVKQNEERSLLRLREALPRRSELQCSRSGGAGS